MSHTEQYSFFGIIGQNEKMRSIFKLIRKVARTDSTVLITGESGTGKEVVARAIHRCSTENSRPMISVNCGAIPSELLESELFGYEKGAFTGAVKTKVGKFEAAGSGTIFLDEIGDMCMPLQVKLLRVLQEKEFERLGGTTPLKCRARIITATNKDLEKEVKEKNFREDLYYRLNVIPLHIPPLRERKDDLGILIRFFFSRFIVTKNPDIKGIDKEALEYLIRYNWPGNVRELENLMERMIILADGDTISVEDIPDKVKRNQMTTDVEGLSIEEVVVNVLKDFSLTLTHGEEDARMPKLPAKNKEVSRNENMKTPSLPSRNKTSAGELVSEISLSALQEENQNLKGLMDNIEIKLINEALEKSNGVKQVAADILGIKRTTLTEKIKKFSTAIVQS